MGFRVQQVQLEQIQMATKPVKVMKKDQHREYPMEEQEEVLREQEMRYCVNSFENTVSEQFWISDVGQLEHHLGLEPRPLKQTVTMDHRQEDHNQEFLQIQTAIQTHLVIKILEIREAIPEIPFGRQQGNRKQETLKTPLAHLTTLLELIQEQNLDTLLGPQALTLLLDPLVAPQLGPLVPPLQVLHQGHQVPHHHSQLLPKRAIVAQTHN